MRLADEADQLIGIVEVTGRRGTHRRSRQVSAQSNNALHTCFAGNDASDRGNVRARRTHAGEVRRNLYAGVFDHRDQRVVRAVLVGTARAVRDGKIVGAQCSKLRKSQPAASPRLPACAAETARTKNLAAESIRSELVSIGN